MKLKYIVCALIALSFMASCDFNFKNSKNNSSQIEDTTLVMEGDSVVVQLKDTARNRRYDGLTVSGSQLYTIYGEPFVMRGVNMHWAWSGESGMAQLAAIGRTGANAVRVVLADGDAWTATPVEEVAMIVEECRKLGMVAVLEVHDATGNDTTEALLNAARYFASLSSELSGTENFVIVNIANEWMKSCNDSLWADAYAQAIGIVRNAGLKHCIMVDSDGYGQGVECIKRAGAYVLNSDIERNVIFSVHMYGTAGNSQRVRSAIDDIIAQDLALCIGEFGWYHTDGDVDEDLIMSHCAASHVGWLAWSWHGNGESVNYLDLVTKADDETSYNAPEIDKSLSCEWGKKVLTRIRKEAVKVRM